MTIQVCNAEEYQAALVNAVRPGSEKVHAFYDHRVGCICTDPKLMLMPWDDHLVHRGDGVFETAKFVGRKLYQLEPHLKRLARSSSAIHINPPCSFEEIGEAVKQVCRAGGRENGLVRVLLGRGPGGFGIDPDECPLPSLYIVAYDLTIRPPEYFERGVTGFKTSVPAKQPYLATIKSIDYLPNVLMKREAHEKGYDLPICFDRHGFLAEGAVDNICIVDQQGSLVIPEFTNALAGTTLMRGVDLVKNEMNVVFRGVRESELREAREVISMGTTLDAIAVVRYRDKPIHDARPGPVAKRLKELLVKDLEENGIPL